MLPPAEMDVPPSRVYVTGCAPLLPSFGLVRHYEDIQIQTPAKLDSTELQKLEEIFKGGVPGLWLSGLLEAEPSLTDPTFNA